MADPKLGFATAPIRARRGRVGAVANTNWTVQNSKFLLLIIYLFSISVNLTRL